MSDLIKHKDQTGAVVDDPAADVKLTWWNKEHQFAGGNHGALAVRDTASSDGAGWLLSAVRGVLAAQGSGTNPTYTPRPDLDGILFPLSVPSAPSDGFMWIDASGTSPSRVIRIMLQDQGSARVLLSVTV